jgi:hypothetical protein
LLIIAQEHAMKLQRLFTLFPLLLLLFQYQPPENFGPQELAANDNFGAALAISGKVLAIGAPGVDLEGARSAGAVFVFQGGGHDWSEVTRLTPEPAQELSGYGFAVALDGNTLAVGARYEYNPESGNGSGAVYIYTQNGNDWTLQGRLAAPDGQPFDLFGYSLALKGDTLAVGARAANAPDGRRDTGAVYLYQRSGDSWYLQARLLPADTGAIDHFGESLALGENELFASAPEHDAPQARNSGIVYVYQRQGQAWVESDRLRAETLRPGARFGSQLSLDSELLVVIASQEAHDENAPAMAIMYGGDYGVAYIFHRQGDQWRQQARLAPTSQDPENNPVRLVSAALDGGARGGARLALTGYGREVYYPYLLKDQEWQALDSVTAGEMYFLGEGQAITFSANTVLLGNRFFPRYNPNDMSEPQLDAAGAIIPIDWPE